MLHARIDQSALRLAIVFLLVVTFLGALRSPAAAQSATPVASPAAASADWPMFRGDPAHTGVSSGPAPAGAPVERWRFHAAGGINSNPAIVDGVVYTGCGCPIFYALDAATGKERWRYTGTDIFDTNPAVADGVVYAGNADGKLYAFDAATGALRWTFPGARNLVGPVVMDGVIYIGGADGNLYALDPDGKERWRAPLGSGASRSATVAEDLVFIGDVDGIVHAVEQETGKEVWRFQTEGGGATGTVVVADGLAYFGTDNADINHLYAVDAKTGSVRWRFAVPKEADIRGPAVRDGVAYAASDGGVLYALDAKTGAERWRFTAGGPIYTSPVIVGDLLIFPSDDRHLYALDPAGKVQWAFPIDGPTTYGAAVADGVAYQGAAFGTLYAVAGSGRPLTPEMANASPSPAATPAAVAVWATPTAFAAPLQPVWRSVGGPKPLDTVAGIALAPNGDLWVVDGGNNQIQIFAPDGTFREAWNGTGGGKAFVFVRSDGGADGDVAFAPDGGFYVVEPGAARVQSFGPDRTLRTSWGSFGPGPGQFVEPVGLALASDGTVFVIDDKRGDIQQFAADGRYLRTIAGDGTATGILSNPGYLTVAPDGGIWAAEAGANRIVRAAPGGTATAIGASGAGPGQFAFPVDVATDAAGDLFVADFDNARVQVIAPTGQVLAVWDVGTTPSGKANAPYAVALDGKGGLFVAGVGPDGESESNVQKFRLPPSFAPAGAATPAA